MDMEIESDVSRTEDQSMDITNNSIIVSEEDSHTYQASTQNGRVTERDEENINPVSRHQSCVSVASRMHSSRWPSTAAPDADTA